jgi:hypothetical protein
MQNLYLTLLVSAASGVVLPRLGWWVLATACVLNLLIGRF